MKTKFSIIMPVYNREDFLKEAVDSIILQSYGIENIEIVLVDDGSTDSSPEICEAYASKYPDQIKVIHQVNQGASAARNAGVKVATGEWLNFLDSDDRLSKNALMEVARFIKRHKNETDVIALPIFFFGERSGEHILNGKFHKGSRVIDLREEWNCPQMSLNSTFVRADIARKYAFDQDVHIATGEDAREILRCLYDKQTLGVATKARYWYRKHSQYSLLGDSKNKKEKYSENILLFHCFILNWYKMKCDTIPKFIQNAVLYDIQWRLKQATIPQEVLTTEEIVQYKKALKEVIAQVSDDIILKQKNIYKEHQSYALYLKYNCYPMIKYNENRAFFVYSNQENEGIIMDSLPVRLSFFKVENDILYLQGFVFYYLYLTEEPGNYYINVNKKLYPLNLQKTEKTVLAIEEKICEKYFFDIRIPIKEEIIEMVFVYKYHDMECEIKKIIYEKFFPLDDKSSRPYYHTGNILFYEKEAHLFLRKKKMPCFCNELIYIYDLLKKRRRGSRKAILVHLLFYCIRPFVHRPIWLIMDRLDKADDNGEVFYRYLLEQSTCKAKVYFAIRKGTMDYERLQGLGNIVDCSSAKYKLLFLFAEYFISSQADEEVINPFHGYRSAYKSLNMPKFIFLQHGIIMNDLSDWLNRFNKNIYGFITSVSNEYDYIIENYDYSVKNVWLTGLARFDKLISYKQKIITIMPTWRKNLRPRKNAENNNKIFLESDYYCFYSSLLLNSRLQDTARRMGYIIQFKIHPALIEYQKLFEKNKNVRVVGQKKYVELYAESALIITDYSSAVFDFAYLKKPIIYAQFDEQYFFSGAHIVKHGYFDYRRDGFGEVETTLDGVVDRIIEYMNNDCQMKEVYRQRVDDFFYYHDKNNCKRIYDKLLSESDYE